MYVTPLPLLQYSPIIELGKLALGVFQILKALILTRPNKKKENNEVHNIENISGFLKYS